MVELKINGKRVVLNEFVTQLVEAQILALVRTLHDIPENIDEVLITIAPE